MKLAACFAPNIHSTVYFKNSFKPKLNYRKSTDNLMVNKVQIKEITKNA